MSDARGEASERTPARASEAGQLCAATTPRNCGRRRPLQFFPIELRQARRVDAAGEFIRRGKTVRRAGGCARSMASGMSDGRCAGVRMDASKAERNRTALRGDDAVQLWPTTATPGLAVQSKTGRPGRCRWRIQSPWQDRSACRGVLPGVSAARCCSVRRDARQGPVKPG